MAHVHHCELASCHFLLLNLASLGQFFVAKMSI